MAGLSDLTEYDQTLTVADVAKVDSQPGSTALDAGDVTPTGSAPAVVTGAYMQYNGLIVDSTAPGQRRRRDGRPQLQLLSGRHGLPVGVGGLWAARRGIGRVQHRGDLICRGCVVRRGRRIRGRRGGGGEVVPGHCPLLGGDRMGI